MAVAIGLVFMATALAVATALGLLGRAIGTGKGMPAFGFLLGFLLGPIGLVIVAIVQPSPARQDRLAVALGMRKCPYCAEYVRPEAIVCRYCHRDLPALGYSVDEAALDQAWKRAYPENR